MWTFFPVIEGKDHLLAHWNRVVNDTVFPLEKRGSKFSFVEMRELLRSALPTRTAKNAADANSYAAALAALLLITPQRSFAQKKRDAISKTLSANLRKQFESRSLDEAQKSALDSASRRVADLGREMADPAEVMSLIKNAVQRANSEGELKVLLAFQSSDKR